MRKLIVSILLITSLSHAGINECFESGKFNPNIGHDTLDCGNVDVVSWAMGVIEGMWELNHDEQESFNAYDSCSVVDPEHESSELLVNACNALLGGE